MRWILDNLALIRQRTFQHMVLALPPILLSFVISLPLGWIAARFRWTRGVLLSVLGLLYAVPSLPLFIALPAVIGTGLRNPLNVVIALSLYGIALMVRACADAIGSVDPDVIQAGTAMGFCTWSRFWRIELPLAGPVLLAGIRVVAVSTVSLTTVGAVLGIKSLGLLFTDGTQRNIPEEIAVGIVLTVAIAVLVDLVLVAIGRLLMPWSQSEAT